MNFRSNVRAEIKAGAHTPQKNKDISLKWRSPLKEAFQN